ncbi:MAG: hypothetical protein CME59_09175 [Halioglobus sp.]|nr:hypothetical protein [Halioglobus sp.]
MLVAGFTALALLPSQATAQEPGSAADCVDERDRSNTGRRRGRGSNRDCEYREVVADPDSETGIVEVDVAPSRSRTVLPRRYSDIPRPTAEQYVEAVPIPDRWRIVDSLNSLGLADYPNKWYDPYNQNTIKGDKPIHGDWFFNVTAISDTVYELREVATPVGVQSTNNAGSLDVLGDTEQWLFNQNIPIELVYYQGDTVFRPPDWEFRLTPVINYNYTELEEYGGVNADPGDKEDRHDHHIGLQAAFVDKHLRNVSHRYDFDSLRVGIQPFSSDFRGFLFQDAPFGVRLFGTRDNNRFQYNLAWFRRMEKDINSGLNDVTEDLRDDDLFIFNLYWQDQPKLGFFSQGTIIYNMNREDNDVFYDNNDFIQRPASIGGERLRDYDVVYVGYNGDGHFGRLNLTVSAYFAYGEENDAVFSGVDSDIEAFFFAAEPGIDFDWIRLRLSFLYGSGDDDPYDDKSQGFDAIFENPQFAGADTSYWIRQGVPLIGGGRVALSQRNGVLNSLRSSKEHGQSNFTNPGILLAGAGTDLDLLPELRLSFNANYLAFAETEVLEAARAQANIDEEIGVDLSAALIWRPFMSQNVVLRLSYAQLLAGDGFEDLYGDEDPYSLLFNAILTF